MTEAQCVPCPHCGKPVAGIVPEPAAGEMIVQFAIKPPLDSARWRALYDAALAAGAYKAHINEGLPHVHVDEHGTANYQYDGDTCVICRNIADG